MKYASTILSKRVLTKSTFVLRFERSDFQFVPGQYLIIHIPGMPQCREYSIYSPADKPFLEILVKEIENGIFSQALNNIEIGAKIEFEGPFGFFVLPQEAIFSKKYLFIATGTGISPFNNIINTYKLTNYKLLHGVRYTAERYEHENYLKENYLSCCSAEAKGDFHGRVTSWLKYSEIDKNSICYLCGNAAMIDECSDILESKGILPENIHSEVFF